MDMEGIMNQNLIPIIILIGLIWALYKIVMKVYINYFNEQLKNRLLKQQDLDSLFNAFWSKLLLSKYDIISAKLKVSLIRGEDINVLLLDAYKYGDRSQKKDVVTYALEYYGMHDNTTRFTFWENKAKTTKDMGLIQYSKMLHDIFILKSGDHINELEKYFDAFKDSQKGYNAYLLYRQYENICDKENANKYKNYARQFGFLK